MVLKNHYIETDPKLNNKMERGSFLLQLGLDQNHNEISFAVHFSEISVHAQSLETCLIDIVIA